MDASQGKTEDRGVVGAEFLCLLKIAWRNIFRNRRRTLLTLSILILGISGLILVGGFFENLVDKLREAYIHSSSGHLQINAKGYDQEGSTAPYEYLIKGQTDLEKLIGEESRIRLVLPRLYFQGMLSSDRNSTSVWVQGVDPRREHEILNLQYQKAGVTGARIISGQDLDEADPYGILVGPGLSRALGLQIGSTVSFITPRPAGSLEGANFHVRGVLDTALKEAGDRLVRIPVKTAQQILGIPDQAHSFLVILQDTRWTGLTLETLQGRLKSNSQPLEILRWEDQAMAYWQSKSFLNRIIYIVQAILAVIFFFSIANTINMSLFERMREYGTMMAIGNTRATVFGAIFLEAALLGLLGSLLGLGVGSVLAKSFSALGILIPAPPPAAPNVEVHALILVRPILLLQSFAVGVSSTLLAAIVPAYRASHMPIVRALGYV